MQIIAIDTPKLAHVTFLISIRYSNTEGMIEYFNFMHKRILRMYNLENITYVL